MDDQAEEQTPGALTTAHGTTVYFDVDAGEVRHDDRFSAPPNLRVRIKDDVARLERWTGERRIEIGCASVPPHSCVCGSSTAFAVEARDSGAFSLKADGKYLSAEANGRVTLSRAEAKAWEMFRIEPAGDEPLRIAAFTMVYNDVFLPMWLDYYGREFGRENLYVIDHGSTDGSVEDGVGYNVLRVPRSGGLDEEQRAAFNSDFQSALLKFYDVVVFADADEILIADPARFDGLSDFIARRCESHVTAIGLEVIHAQESEAPLDGSKPVLQQRAHVQFAAEYCKTLVARVPLTWGAGCHSTQRSAQIDRDLYLFHLKRMDHDLAIQNHRKARALRWSRSAVRKHHGIQTRISEEEFIAKVVRPGVHAIAAASDHFDFGKDIKRVPTGSGAATIFRGSVSRIPERFRAVDLRLTPRV